MTSLELNFGGRGELMLIQGRPWRLAAIEGGEYDIILRDQNEHSALAKTETTLQATFLQIQDLNVSYLKKFCERVQANATTSQRLVAEQDQYREDSFTEVVKRD
ncbi:hypothetical protein ACFE04_004115 [Oxalis oulophora]